MNSRIPDTNEAPAPETEIEMTSAFQAMDLVKALMENDYVYHNAVIYPPDFILERISADVSTIFRNGRIFGRNFMRLYVWVNFETKTFGLSTKMELLEEHVAKAFQQGAQRMISSNVVSRVNVRIVRT